jgi:hypothetical protein
VFGIDVTNTVISMVTAATAAPAGRLAEHAGTIVQLAERAEVALAAAVDAFQRAGDKLNEALVCCNAAKLMRARSAADAAFQLSTPSASAKGGTVGASSSITTSSTSTTTTTTVGHGVRRRQHLERAVEFYRKAHLALGNRRSHPEVWDSVSLDIAGTYVALATMASESGVSSSSSSSSGGGGGGGSFNSHGEDAAVAYLEKALKVCDAQKDVSGASRDVMLRRAADIHRRLGGIYARRSAAATAAVGSLAQRDKLRRAGEMHMQRSLAAMAGEQTAAAALARVEVKVELAALQATQDGGGEAAVGTLSSLASQVEELMPWLAGEQGARESVDQLQAAVAKALLAAMKAHAVVASGERHKTSRDFVSMRTAINRVARYNHHSAHAHSPVDALSTYVGHLTR